MFLYLIPVICFVLNSCHCLPNTADESGSLTCSHRKYVDHNKVEDGFYLGSKHNSHISYSFNSENFQVLNVSLDIRTLQQDGMVFYVRGSLPKDFYALYYSHGNLQVSYYCDDFAMSYGIGVQTNDGRWYTLQFTSDETKTEFVIIDETLFENKIIYTGKTQGCKHRALLSPFYFGSVGNNHHEMAKSHLEDHNYQFVGCMRNIVVDGPELKNLTRSGVIPCLQQAEGGVAFSSVDSYVMVDEHFGLHKVYNLQMKIKPKTNDGILLFYQSGNSSDNLILQLVNGSLKLTVTDENTTLDFNSTLCDGKWHTLWVIRRKDLYTMVMNDRTSSPIFQRTYDPTNIFGGSGPLYLGGVPTTYSVMGHQYIGCVNNLDINERQYDVFTYKFWGNVTANLCPI